MVRIACDECTRQDSDACADCVVSYICSREADDAVVIDVAEARAIRLLARAGLVPELRHTAVGERAEAVGDVAS